MFPSASRRRLGRAGPLAAALLLAGLAPAVSASASPTDHAILGAGSSAAIPDNYVVKLKDNTAVRTVGVAARARALTNGHNGKLGHVWESAIRGFAVTMSENDAKKLAADPDVEYVQQQQIYQVFDTQDSPPSWGQDRIDQRALPLDTTYSYDASAGASVHAYVIDSGIRTTHTDFGTRATSGYDFVENDTVAQDCNGHGTHVAGIVGGTSYGVAKRVQLVAVRVFDCGGTGGDQPIIDAINWVTTHAIKPAVINMSLGTVCRDGSGATVPCPTGAAQGIIDAEKAAIAAGIPVVTSAGNEDADACNNPVGSAAGTINVAATDNTDKRWVENATRASNFGLCVDIWAPGDSITSTHNGSDSESEVYSGTSQAAPHVTGAVALLMDTPQFAAATPAQIAAELDKRATVGAIVGLDSKSPNKLLFVSPPPVTGGCSIALARNADGRLTLAGVDKAGFMYVATQSAANSSSWGSPTKSTSKGWWTIGAEPNAANRLELAILTPADQVWHRQQTAVNANTWTGLSQLDGALMSVAIARSSTGRLEMFGANEQGQAFHRLQTDQNSTTWTPWTPFNNTWRLRSITAETRTDGRIVVVAVDSRQHVSSTTQAVAGTDTWSAFTEIVPPTGSRLMREVAMARNSNGTLELTGTDSVGGVWHTTQLNGNWSNWVPLSSSKTLLHIAAETNLDGRVQVVGVDTTGAVWQSAQNSAGSTVFSAWTKIDGLTLRP